MLLDEAIEEITKLLIEEQFKNQKEVLIQMSKKDLYRFCIRLLKILKEAEEGNYGKS